jgi:hypothetical protein
LGYVFNEENLTTPWSSSKNMKGFWICHYGTKNSFLFLSERHVGHLYVKDVAHVFVLDFFSLLALYIQVVRWPNLWYYAFWIKIWILF